MRTAVIYRSKTGFARKYAEWIAQELSADLFDASDITAGKLEPYDAVVYGGGLYAVGINGVSFITKNLDRLAGKRIAVFATGSSPLKQKVIDDVTARNFTPAQMERIRFFYLRGGFDMEKLPWHLKMVMGLMGWMLRRKKELNEDEAGMLAAMDTPADFTDRKNIEELVRYLREG
ncbi:MAG TPA: flavodoxin domain-containing protein [bacterium]|nr:flavodoxin domain-containing protein [bacterium]